MPVVSSEALLPVRVATTVAPFVTVHTYDSGGAPVAVPAIVAVSPTSTVLAPRLAEVICGFGSSTVTDLVTVEQPMVLQTCKVTVFVPGVVKVTTGLFAVEVVAPAAVRRTRSRT